MFIKNLVLLVSRQVLSDMLSSNLSFGISFIHEANYWLSGSTLRIPGIWIIDHLNILGLDCTMSIAVHRALKCEICIYILFQHLRYLCQYNICIVCWINLDQCMNYFASKLCSIGLDSTSGRSISLYDS